MNHVCLTKRARKQLGLIGIAAVAVASTAVAAPIGPGESAYKPHPDVTETPSYTTALPAYFVPGNVVGSLVSPIAGDLTGSITSTVYRNPATGWLTFAYVTEASQAIPSPIVRATLGGFWSEVDVTDAGADASGNSGTGDPDANWTDGDPYYVERSPIDGAPAIQWRFNPIGSALGPGDVSSVVWFETDAPEFTQAMAAFLDTAAEGSATILAPIPTPGSAVVAVLGVGLLAGRRRRS